MDCLEVVRRATSVGVGLRRETVVEAGGPFWILGPSLCTLVVVAQRVSEPLKIGQGYANSIMDWDEDLLPLV